MAKSYFIKSMEFIADKQRKLSKLALYNFKDLSYSTLMKLLRNKDVKVNGVRVNKDVTLNVGDKVELYYKLQKTTGFSIVYSDENVVIINKKQGYTSEEIFESVKEQYKGAGFIHRLDRNTSGIMIFSLNGEAEKELINGFKTHSFIKIYLATVYGKMPKKSDLLTAYLVKDSDNAIVKIYDKKVNGSSLIKTGYEVVKEEENTSLLRVRLYTGKTHQIRAHLAHVGHFIIGDGKYGDNEINKKMGKDKQMLSAYELTLVFDEKSCLNYLNNKTFCIE